MKPNYTTEVDFIAELIFRTPEQGGRTTPVSSGYRPNIKFPFDDMLTSGQQIYIGQDHADPSEIVKANIKIIAVEHFKNRLTENMEFDFTEGASVIGTGKILELVNNELKKRWVTSASAQMSTC